MIAVEVNQTEKGRRRKQSQLEVMLRLCERIAEFMRKNGGAAFKAFFARDGGAVGLYLMTTAEAYDFELGDRLVEFAAPYIERGLLGSVTLLPASSPEELAAYFDPTRAIRVEIRDA
jgi:hypothetical protein